MEQDAQASIVEAAVEATQTTGSIDSIWLSAAGVFFLLILSGFFSGSETAFTAASKARMHQKIKEGSSRAKLVEQLREKKEKLIGAILLGNNLVNILSTALATVVLTELFGASGVAYATIAMTLLVLIFAEVLPKTYAILYADKMALALAPILQAVVFVLSPITETISGIVKMVLKLFGVNPEDINENTAEELRGAIELHQGDEIEVKEERAMLRSILDLGNVSVEEVMTHRKKVVMVDVDWPMKELVTFVTSSRHMRIPVYKETQDNVIGIINVRDIVRELVLVDGDYDQLDLIDTMSDPWFIPESTTLLDQMKAFQEKQAHIAMVVDEYGAIQGVVTLEDILEEIVGEITDETDIRMEGVRPQPNGSYIVDGTVTIRDLNREFEWNLPDANASTVAGLVLDEARKIPEVGQSFNFYGFRFDIMRRKRNQITVLKIVPPLEELE